MTTAELRRRAAELGLDAIGVARAEPYAETERHIRERRARGLFGAAPLHDLAGPSSPATPSGCSRGALDRRLGGALLLRARSPSLAPGRGPPAPLRLARRLRRAARAARRLGRELGAPYRVLVDSNDHVDREAAARSGVGFYGKNTMLITPRHGSWVVLGTLVTAAELEPTAAVARGLRLLHALRRGLPDRGARRARRARRDRAASPTGRRCPSRSRSPTAQPLGAQVYGCDICQEVCPWNRGVERRRAGLPPDPAAHVDLLAWLGRARRRRATTRSRRLYVPRNDRRCLRRNALVALGNVGGGDPAALRGAAPLRGGRRRSCSPSTPAGRSSGWRRGAAEGPRALDLARPPDRASRSSSCSSRSRPHYPPGWAALGLGDDGRASRSARSPSSSLARSQLAPRHQVAQSLARADLRHRRSSPPTSSSSPSSRGTARPADPLHRPRRRLRPLRDRSAASSSRPSRRRSSPSSSSCAPTGSTAPTAGSSSRSRRASRC